MERIKRDTYLKRLIERRENGQIKVLTGLRGCGKSYLLFHIFYEYLREDGIPDSRILQISLADDEHRHLRDSKKLGAYLREKITDEGMWYVFLDEVQLCKNFESVLNGLHGKENVDTYVTGSNSRFLTTEVLAEFRGKSDEVRIYPLTFSEFLSAHRGDRYEAWLEYITYGGLPLILGKKTDELKSAYLIGQCREVYLKDMEERYHLRSDNVMGALLDVLAAAVGSFASPSKLAKTFGNNGILTNDKTIGVYLGCLTDSFLITKAERYDIRGKRYIASPFKFYFTDVGIRNARLVFRRLEEERLMENIVYNEMLVRGFQVDVGIVEHMERDENRRQMRQRLEVDFVCNRGNQRYYIQTAFSSPDSEQLREGENSLMRIGDSFKKIIVVRDRIKPWRTEDGVVVMDIMEFLLNPDSLDF